MTIPTVCGLLVASALAAAGDPGFRPNALHVAVPAAGAMLELSPSGAIADTIAGGGALDAAGDFEFSPSGTVFVASGAVVHELAADGTVVRTIGSGLGYAELGPLALGPDGQLYVAAPQEDVVLRFGADGTLLGELGAGSGLDEPRGVAFGPAGRLYVASRGDDRILVFGADGAFHDVFAMTVASPRHLEFAPTGALFAASGADQTVVVLDPLGAVTGTLGAGLALGPAPLPCVGPDGNLYVAAAGGRIELFDAAGVHLATFATVPPASGGLGFAPYRFRARIEGSIGLTGEKPAPLTEKVVIAVHPGRGFLGLLFEDDPANPSDLATRLGASQRIFHGFVIPENKGKTYRQAQGFQLAPDDFGSGFATLGLRLKGKLDASSRFVVQSGVGTLHDSTDGVVFSGDVILKQLLP
jgi:hypothetical protein